MEANGEEQRQQEGAISFSPPLLSSCLLSLLCVFSDQRCRKVRTLASLKAVRQVWFSENGCFRADLIFCSRVPLYFYTTFYPGRPNLHPPNAPHFINPYHVCWLISCVHLAGPLALSFRSNTSLDVTVKKFFNVITLKSVDSK